MYIEDELGFVQYFHHGVRVWSHKLWVGQHKEHCMCYQCAKFKPGHEDNCPIAKLIYALDVEYSLVTPVFECKEFVRKPTEELKIDFLLGA